MKVFFDTNVYVAEALLGGGADQMLKATARARWRIISSNYVLDETERVLTEQLGFSRRLAQVTREYIRRRAVLVDSPVTRHEVVHDPADSAILRAALAAGADLLVTNDSHLLTLNPYESLQIISMSEYFRRLVDEGFLTP
jgi:uncharacterized protein